jgi:hypothetical protein
MESFRELLRLTGGSQKKTVSNFWRMTSEHSVEIDSSVESIALNDLCDNTSFDEVVFSSPSHLREISGFCECTSLC